MFRGVLSVLTAILIGSLLLSPLQAQNGAGIKLGEKLEGELTDRSPTVGNPLPGGGVNYYAAFPITLKAGQTITISASVVGKGRLVWVSLYEPTGKILGWSPWNSIKTTQYVNEEVSASGKYMIRVHSDLIGPFTLRVTGPADEEVNIKALETRIEQLEKELTAARARLKALKGGGRLPDLTPFRTP